jgi:hypothetical protein
MAPYATASIKRQRPAIRAIYSPRQGQVKNGEIIVFRGFYPELPLFAGEGTDI